MDKTKLINKFNETGQIIIKGKSSKRTYSFFIYGLDKKYYNFVINRIIDYFFSNRNKYNVIISNKIISDKNIYLNSGIYYNPKLQINEYCTLDGMISIGKANLVISKLDNSINVFLSSILDNIKNIKYELHDNKFAIYFTNYDLFQFTYMSILNALIKFNNTNSTNYDLICENLILPFINDSFIGSLMSEKLKLTQLSDYLAPIPFYNEFSKNFLISCNYSSIDDFINKCLEFFILATED